MSGHIAPLRLYLGIFAALIVLTVATVAVSRVDLGAWNGVVALTIAGVKATLVVMFFMHVRWSGRLIPLFLAAGVFWLALLIVLTLGDVLTRSWPL